MFRPIFLFSLLLLLSCEDDLEHEVNNKIRDPNPGIICYFPSMPTFPGGHKSLEEFVVKNLKYPRACVEGRVYVGFSVNTDGSLSEIEIIKGLCEICDKNAIELFHKMPKWVPGKMEDKPVKTKMFYPVKFSLSQ